MFEYLADNRGYESAPEELMVAAVRNSMVFDAAVLVKRYRVPLHHTYLGRAIVATDVGRIRFALSHGQVPVAMHYTQLFHSTDVGVLSEVLRARKVDGVLPGADRSAGVTVQRRSDEGTVGSCLLPTRRVGVSQSAARRMGLWPGAPWR